MKKTIIAAAIAAVFSASAYAQNLGFEDGNTTGWTSTTLSAVGSTTTQAGSNTWVINPYGSYMGQLQIQSGNFNQMTSALGLTGSSSTAITTLLQQQAQTGGGNPNPTTAGWVTREVTLTAGQTFTLAWQYISVDYVPFNDGSIATLTQNGTSNATVNNYNQQYALLGFTNPGTGDYSTGSYGATGWQVATFQVSVDGTYTLGFGVFNLGDTALSPVLYIDEVQGTTTLNGQAFGAVAPNNDTAPSSPAATPPSPPPPPAQTSTVDSGATAGTGNLASTVTVNGGTIQISSNNVTLTNTFTVDNGGMTVDQNGNVSTFNGVISGAGGVTIANTGNGGGVTFAAVNTYTGTTTVNSGANLSNTGTIAGTVTNLGAFTNSGTTGNVTNGFNGDGNTATLINSGTTGNVTNFSNVANSGTTGTVNNFGTFNNTGTTGTFNNAGVLNNTVGGVVNELGYNNHWVQNSGTINNITYNGGTVINNANGTIGTINNAEAHGNFHNDGTVTGNVTTNSTFNNNATGVVQGLYTNTGTLNNAGTVGTVTNDGTFSNTGTAGDIINGGTFNNNGTIGNSTNSGTMTNSGNAGTITNTGTLTQTGGTASVINTGSFTLSGGTLDAYTQNAPGTTTIAYNTPFTVSGAAILGGGLTINGAPTAYGKYTVLSAGSVNGTYDSFTSAGANDYLKYSGSDVKLYVTPSATATQSSIDSVAGSLGNAINLNSSIASNSLGSDCSVFGESGACVGINLGQTAAAGGDLNTGSITLGKRLNDNWRVGVFANAPMNSTSVGSIETRPNTAYGGYIGWNKNTDGKGLGITASAAQGNGAMKITRNGPEVGVGNTTTDTKAYQVRATYAVPVNETVTVTPYIGIRRTETNVAGYTEQGPVFPLTVNGTSQSATDIIAGATVGKQFTNKLSGSVTAGVIQTVSQTNPVFTGTSEIGSMNTFGGVVPNNGKANPSLSAGIGYNIDKTTRVGASVGWQQRGSNADVTTIGISITKGF